MYTAPGPQLLEEEELAWTVVSVGGSMPATAFSTVCCSREFFDSPAFHCFLRAYKLARSWVQTSSSEVVAAAVKAFFPGISEAALVAAIQRYQQLGTWLGSDVITPDLYEQSHVVFLHSKGISRRHPFEQVCKTP